MGPVREVMHTTVEVVAPDTPIKDAVHLMADKKIGGVPVVSDGVLVGLVTTTDVLRYVERLA